MNPTLAIIAPEVPTAASILDRLRRQGYQAGPPDHLQDWALLIDVGTCRKLKCPGCHQRGMVFKPHHRGRSYRVVAECPRCGAGQEV